MRKNEQYTIEHQWTGRRKSKRPLHFKTSTHLILRLKEYLPALFQSCDQQLRHLIYKIAQKYNIRIYRLVLNYSHMHGVMLLPNRQNYNSFIRELTAMITQYFTEHIMYLVCDFKKFFKLVHLLDQSCGRAYKILLKYMEKNEVESGWPQKIIEERIRSLYRVHRNIQDLAHQLRLFKNE